MKERIKYIDATKGIGMLMIMLGHITVYDNPVDTWMSSFKVSLFYIISGFLMSYSGSVKGRNFKNFLSKLLNSLALPYLMFSIIGIIFKTACVLLKHQPMTEVFSVFWEYLMDCIFLKGINSMWFIPSLFIGEIVFFWIVRSPKVIKIIYGIFGVFAITLTNMLTGFIENTITAVSLSWIKEDVIRLINATGKSLCAAWFIGAGYIIYIFYKKIKGKNIKLALGSILSLINIVLSQINLDVDINSLKEGTHTYLFYICGIIGTLGAIMILDYLSSYINMDLINYLGKNSLIIMCTHTVLGMRSVAYSGWSYVAYMPDTGNLEYIFKCLIVLIILIFIECGIITFINRYCPFLIGKSKIITKE